jgi:hypothetical protein
MTVITSASRNRLSLLQIWRMAGSSIGLFVGEPIIDTPIETGPFYF